jgi:hypothetical protein
VDNPFHWFVDYLATEPVRVSAILRLPLIGLIAVLVWIWEVDHWLPELYAVILGVYAVAAVLWLIAVFRGPVPRWADWASTIVDLLVIVALCLVSGGATSALLPVFFLLPISVAFGDRPALTAIFGIVTEARRQNRPAEHRVHAFRLPAVAGRRDDGAVLRACPTVVARQGITGSTPPAGFRGHAGRRATQPRSGRAPA